jgi:hypothetical protein
MALADGLRRLERLGGSRLFRVGGGLALLLIVLVLLHGDWIARYLENAGKDGWYTDDVRNLLGFFVYAEPEVHADDVVGAYSRAQSPILHWAVVASFAKLDLLRALTQYGPPVVWAATALLAARAGAALGRWPGALLAATLVLAIPPYPERIAGFLPRALAFPGIFWFAHGLIRGRPREAGAAVIALAGFYPTVAAVLGFAFAGWRLFFAGAAGPRAPLGRRLGAVAAVGALSVLLLVPTMVRLAEFGPTTSNADWQAYPEAGPSGITGPGDRWPWRGMLEELHIRQGRLLDDRPWLAGPRQALGGTLFDDTVLLCTFVLVGLRARRDRRTRRLLILGAAALFGYWVTRVFYPMMYAPTRALQFVWPPFFHLALVAATAEVARFFERGIRRWARGEAPTRRRVRRYGTWVPRLIVFGLVVAIVSGPGESTAGFVFRQSERDLMLECFVADLPPETHVAGMPDDPMSNLAWLSGRQAFMTGEMHIPHHVGYLARLRPRLFDFFDAYFAHDLQRVLDFAEKYDVTHFLVDDRHFGKSPPGYMPPFGGRIRQRQRESQRRGGFALARHGPVATVFARPPLRLVAVDELRSLVGREPDAVTR